jgi:hypothetical protein
MCVMQGTTRQQQEEFCCSAVVRDGGEKEREIPTGPWLQHAASEVISAYWSL